MCIAKLDTKLNKHCTIGYKVFDSIYGSLVSPFWGTEPIPESTWVNELDYRTIDSTNPDHTIGGKDDSRTPIQPIGWGFFTTLNSAKRFMRWLSEGSSSIFVIRKIKVRSLRASGEWEQFSLHCAVCEEIYIYPEDITTSKEL